MYIRVCILIAPTPLLLFSRFLRNPTELKSIKNISLLRQQMEAQAAAQKLATATQHVHQAIVAAGHQQQAALAAQASSRGCLLYTSPSPRD